MSELYTDTNVKEPTDDKDVANKKYDDNGKTAFELRNDVKIINLLMNGVTFYSIEM